MRRSLVGTVLPLGIALAFALAAVVEWSRLPLRTSYRAECPPVDVPLARDKSLGVNSDLSPLSDAARNEALAAMSGSGLLWLRQRFPWDRIEPERGTYEWTTWDRIVSDAAQHGMHLVAVLDGAPSWARDGNDLGNPLAPPRETSDYGWFVSAFAARYGGQIDYYQVWDEPNIAPHWGNRWVDPAAYFRLLREGAIQLRTADPGAVVLLAALAPNVEAGGANMSDVGYLNALYTAGAAEWFDVVAAEPYGFDFAAQAAAAPQRLNFARAELLRAVMQQHQDLTTPIWAVSFGWPGDQGHAQPVVENLHGAVDYARTAWPWMGPMFWAAWSPDDAQGRYALAPLSGGAGVALGALQAAPDQSQVASAGWYPADHSSGTYHGGWRVTPEGADIGASGDSLEIAFLGTRLDLAVRRGDYRGFLYVKVDGLPTNVLPRDSEGRSYVVLYDPSEDQATVTLARGLEAKKHTAEMVAEGGWGQWSIVGWSTCDEHSSPAPWVPLVLAAGAAVCLLVGAGRAWSRWTALPRTVYRLIERYRGSDIRIALLIGAAAGLCVYASVGTVQSLVALAFLAVVLFLRPEVGTCLIALSLPFWQPGKPLFGKVFSMVEILTWLTAGAWLASQLLRPGTPRRIPHAEGRVGGGMRLPRLSALDWGVAGLVLLGALSLLWAEHTREAAREWRTVLLDSALFYLLLRNLARSSVNRWRVVDSWVLGGALIALVGVGQWLLGRNVITAEGVWRVRGFYGSPNNLALYLGRILPLAVAIGLWGARGARRWLYAAAALSLCVAIVLTYSRGAWLLGVPLSLLFLTALRGRRPLLVAAGVLLVAALLAAVVLGAGRVASLADLTRGTTFLRLQLWRSSLAMIRDHPVLGVGLDNFLYAYRSTYVLPTAWEELNLSHPHNLVLDFWLRLGLPGLAGLGYLLVAFFRHGVRAYRGESVSPSRLLVLGLMAGMVDFVAHGLVDNAFFLVDLAFVFVLMLALVQVPPGPLNECVCDCTPGVRQCEY